MFREGTRPHSATDRSPLTESCLIALVHGQGLKARSCDVANAQTWPINTNTTLAIFKNDIDNNYIGMWLHVK